MAALDVKVEIGLDLGANDPLSFALDDAIKGVLDNTQYTLGGSKFYDITSRVLDVSTKRGKSQALDRIDAGVASITLNNSDRLFDPKNPNSPYFGQLVPRREVRISSNNEPVIFGAIDDLDITYNTGITSTVRIDISDALSFLSNNALDVVSPPSELPGARINRILDLPEVAWPVDQRIIEAGSSLMLDAEIDEGTKTLEYLQLVEVSEFGTLFLSKDNKIIFRERNSTPNSLDIIFTDDLDILGATPIPISTVGVIYGSENLYNRVVLSNADTFPEEITVDDARSQNFYGIRTLNQTGLLVQEAADLQGLANFILGKYKEPQYRFESITTMFESVNDGARDELLELEIGDLINVEFTPSGIPPAIRETCRIIGISHNWTPDSKSVTFSLEQLDFAVFILDNPVLGELDNDRLSY